MKDTFMKIKDKKHKMNCKCPKVPVVDDEPLNIYVLQSYLRTVELPSDIAINGQEALETVKKKNYIKCHVKYRGKLWGTEASSSRRNFQYQHYPSLRDIIY